MKIGKRNRGKLTQAIIAQTRIVGRRMQTATEIARTLEHDPAVVSGILHRLSEQGHVVRLAAAPIVGPRADLKPGTWVY